MNLKLRISGSKPFRILVLTTVTGCLLCMTATAQQFEGDERDIQQILTNIENFSGYYMNADYDNLARAYTRDAKILPPGTDIIEGREAIKQRWIVPDEVQIIHHKIEPAEIKVIGEYAYDAGYYEGTTRRADQTEVSWEGKYLIVWKKEEGEWKIYLDAWNRIDD